MSVYFIEAEGADAIKIGFSTDPVRRLNGMRSGSPVPLRLLASFPATTATERMIHRELADFRIRGEWFRDCHVIRRCVDELPALAADFLRQEAGA